MDSRTYYYARVSSKEQNLDRQIAAFKALGAQEREIIRKRQAEGIEAAKQNGKKLGRPALIFPENWNSVYTSWKAGEITAKTAMEQTGTKRTSFYKLVNMTEKQ